MGHSELSRRSFLGGAIGGAAGICNSNTLVDAATFPIPSFDLAETTIAQLQAEMDAGRLTSQSITAQYLQRIELLNCQGPRLRHVIETNPDAIAIAEKLDAERKEKGARSPLHGVPVLIKDNIDTADRMMTTAGSLALEGHFAEKDAFLVARLRAAGAVILGKANLSEWSNFRSYYSSWGWSARGGQAKNPYALNRSPSGSSSGSAGAVSANLCPVSVGTETNASIVSPSSCCGVVGIKPTVGLVSRTGIIPISSSQDTAGPIARTVADAAVLLGMMTGLDPEDEATSASHGKAERDYSTYLRADGLRGAKVGIFRVRGFHPNVQPILESAIAAIKSAGATIVDPVEVATFGKFGDAVSQLMRYEFKSTLNKYLGGLAADAKVRSIKDVIAFNEQHRDQEMPCFGQEILIHAQELEGLDSPVYQQARDDARRLARDEGLHAALDAHGLDALVALTNGPAHLTDLVNGDHGTGGTSILCAAAGCPSITVPAGHVFGLPVGISFMGRAFAEGTLIKLAYAFEQITNARKPPQFLPSVDLLP